MRVHAYRNLHLPGRTYSVRDPRSGRVCARVQDLVLLLAGFVVQPAGQARVRREGRRNVHAYVVGHVAAPAEALGLQEAQGWRAGIYRPFTDATFVDVLDGSPLVRAGAVWLGAHGLSYLLDAPMARSAPAAAAGQVLER